MSLFCNWKHTPPPCPDFNGWEVYSVEKEFGRMGIDKNSKLWRFSDLNVVGFYDLISNLTSIWRNAFHQQFLQAYPEPPIQKSVPHVC